MVDRLREQARSHKGLAVFIHAVSSTENLWERRCGALRLAREDASQFTAKSNSNPHIRPQLHRLHRPHRHLLIHIRNIPRTLPS
jgi:hypothetical protein